MDTGFLSETERHSVICAASHGIAMGSPPFSAHDLSELVDWARGARRNPAVLELVLGGKVLPLGRTVDNGFGYGTVTNSLSRAEAKTYRRKLARLQAGWKRTPPAKLRMKGDTDLTYLLNKPEIESMRLAVETGNTHWRGPGLDVDAILRAAGKCRNDEGLLGRVLTGDIVPVMYRGSLAFRAIENARAKGRGKNCKKLTGVERPQLEMRRVTAIHATMYKIIKDHAQARRTNEVLAHYAEHSEPQTYQQFDAFLNVEPGDDIIVPDRDGDCIMGTISQELWHDDKSVRVHILNGTDRVDAVRALKKIVRCIEQQTLRQIDCEDEYSRLGQCLTQFSPESYYE